MTIMQISALLVGLIALISWLNAKTFHLTPSIAMLGAGAGGAVVLLAAQKLIDPFWGFNDVRSVVRTMNFTSTVMDYMLGFLLFAGGLQVDLGEIRKRAIAVLTLATVGILLSTAMVGLGVWWVAAQAGVPLPLAWALAFGALISPTDPVAVLGAMRSGAVSARIGAVLQGEALFNDGVGFVAFTTATAFVVSGAAPHPARAAEAVLLEAGGGLVLGVAAASAVVMLMRGVADRVIEVMATVALAIGAYVGAGSLHLSGPIAAAAAGLVVGGFGRKPASGDVSPDYVEVFWEVIDQILNAGLFLLLGLQVFVLPFNPDEIGLWAGATVLVIIARLLVVLPWGAFFHVRHEERGASLVLTWGGLRGAVSLALALSLPQGSYRDTLLSMTFIVVVFSVVAQGLTFAPLAGALRRRKRTETKADVTAASASAGS